MKWFRPYIPKPNSDTLLAQLDSIFKQVKLEWNYGATNVAEFQCLKAETARASLSSWKIVDYLARLIYDEKIATGKTYRYAIRALFNDGSVSNWKEIVGSVP